MSRLAGCDREVLTLPEAATAVQLLQQVFGRHEALRRAKGALYLAVNRKMLPETSWPDYCLAPGDSITVGVKIIGG